MKWFWALLIFEGNGQKYVIVPLNQEAGLLIFADLVLKYIIYRFKEVLNGNIGASGRKNHLKSSASYIFFKEKPKNQ